MRSGFTGGVLIDYPNSSKAKKFFLVLMTGGGQSMPKPLGSSLFCFKSRIKRKNLKERTPLKEY